MIPYKLVHDFKANIDIDNKLSTNSHIIYELKHSRFNISQSKKVLEPKKYLNLLQIPVSNRIPDSSPKLEI